MQQLESTLTLQPKFVQNWNLDLIFKQYKYRKVQILNVQMPLSCTESFKYTVKLVLNGHLWDKEKITR
jgi:hypothetical protein